MYSGHSKRAHHHHHHHLLLLLPLLLLLLLLLVQGRCGRSRTAFHLMNVADISSHAAQSTSGALMLASGQISLNGPAPSNSHTPYTSVVRWKITLVEHSYCTGKPGKPTFQSICAGEGYPAAMSRKGTAGSPNALKWKESMEQDLSCMPNEVTPSMGFAKVLCSILPPTLAVKLCWHGYRWKALHSIS